MTTVNLEPLTMQAAADFWRNKVKLGPAEFAALSNEAKVKAFGVSGIAKGDELTTVFNALQAAIEKGISYGEFKKECAEIFARRGWTGQREWRVQNIFRTNIQTAYNSARWKEQMAGADVFPYLQYNAVNDRRTRPTHAALDGKIFPINHPFWNTWYPPNGYRCRCSTLSLTEKQIKRKGLAVETEDPTDQPIEIANPRTGAKMTVQQLLPDPGFDHHPGKVVWGGIADQAERGAYRAMEGLSGPTEYNRLALAEVPPRPGGAVPAGDLLPGGKDDLYYGEEFLRRYGEEAVVKDALGEPVILSRRALALSEPAQGAVVPVLREMLASPYEIWLTPEQDEATGRVRLVKSYVALVQAEGQKQAAGVAVGEVIDGVYRGITAALPEDGKAPDWQLAESRRRGLLLYPKR